MATAVLVLTLCSALTAVLLRSQLPAPDAVGRQGLYATGAPLMGNEDTWAATLPQPGLQPPAELMRGALGCVPLFQWATEAGAVPRGQVTLAYSVGAPPSRAAVVRGVRVVRGPAVPDPRGGDVACSGQVNDERLAAVAVARGKPVQAVHLSLDDAGSRQESPLPVRAGGTATGLVTVTTATCTCAWWLELDVEEDGRQVTVRVDDDGRPFTLAPPTTPLSTSADRELLAPRPLSRAFGDPQPSQAGVSATAALVPTSESWEAESDAPLDPAAAVGGEARLGRVGCRRMYDSVVRAGGVPAGDHQLELVITGPPGMEGAVLDARVRLETVRLDAEERYRYACARSGVNPHAHVETPDIARRLYPHTLMHPVEPLPDASLHQDHDRSPGPGVGLSVPLATNEPFSFSRTGLDGRERPDGRGAFGTGAVIVPQEATFGMTVEVTVTLPTGERAAFTLTDHGKPFLLGPCSDMLSPAHQQHFHEPDAGPNVHYDEERLSW
ncbi:hypothetical protein OG311_25250 [Streptomyces sp. NBC_01343]|uniref:hypothetical protein n=1 Tax=Streptomyces sp. NBC_01343 TaxID=2903832 RepID=UPI002E12A8B5|nr:hypothetical protein OG311_25250 [Streptomyces sp. NBC_01343]